jgi:hypothetical protein
LGFIGKKDAAERRKLGQMEATAHKYDFTANYEPVGPVTMHEHRYRKQKDGTLACYQCGHRWSL